MTRVADLDYRFPAALYRGDGGGVAIVHRSRPFVDGSSWARVTTAGAGITAAYLYLERRYGGDVDGRLVVEDEVSGVSGDADATAPGRTDTDPRFSSLGAFGEVEDAAYARRADAESGAKLRAANESIAAHSFVVSAIMGDRRWRVRVGPTLPDGITTLECHDDSGELRLVDTAADRDELERSRAEPVRVTGSYFERRLFGGMRQRPVTLTLAPEGA